MKITFIGHACFLCESERGLRILLDPYKPFAFDGRIALKPFAERVDIVASTHNHLDHFYIDRTMGKPIIVKGSGVFSGVRFTSLKLPHGSETGKDAGYVTGLRFELDKVSVFHPGDLGRVLTEDEVRFLGNVDILLVPVGGTFTIGPSEAVELISMLRPKVAIPMHYYMEKVIDLRLRPLTDFLTIVSQYEECPSHSVVFRPSNLPPATKVLVLKPKNAS
jgi:L-ascorbate metabolism protein UlaG (beta-lactamase superfamily)